MGQLRRAGLLALILVTAACLPLTALTALLALNCVNPMLLVFLVSFRIENQSGERVQVTPVGTWGEGDKALLPLFATRFPALPALKSRGFALDPGESIRVTYDWDDINLSEIVVRTRNGAWYQLTVDPCPTRDQYHAPRSDRYVIPPLKRLDPVAQTVQDAVQGPAGQLRLWIVASLGVLVPFVVRRLVRLYRAEKAGQST